MTRPVGEPDAPSLFLDTNIILDVLWARETGDDSAELVEKMRNRRWRAVTSSFAIMEVTSQEQEERYVEDQRRGASRFGISTASWATALPTLAV